MPATIWLIRHAQGLHNATHNYDLVDPKLTDQGIKQGQAFWAQTGQHYAKNVALIFASPSIRCIQTARLCLKGPIEDDLKQIVLDPDLMEGSNDLCNIPRTKEDILEEFSGSNNSINADRLVTDEYRDRSPGSTYSDNFAVYHRRAKRALERICRVADSLADDQIIVVVSHYHFLRWMIGDDKGEASVDWRNCQMRPYRFQPDLFRLRDQRYHLGPAAGPNPGSNGVYGLRAIVERARAAPSDPDLDATKPQHVFVDAAKLTWDRAQELAREFAAAARGGQQQPQDAAALPSWRDRRALRAAMRARQLRRYVEVYKADHGFPAAALERAMVLHRGNAWIVAAADEQIWPEGWHPTNPDMPARRVAFLGDW